MKSAMKCTTQPEALNSFTSNPSPLCEKDLPSLKRSKGRDFIPYDGHQKNEACFTLQVIPFLILLLSAVPAFAQPPANHQLAVTISKSTIEVRDTLTLHPDPARDSITLNLRADYQVLSSEILGKKVSGFKILPRKKPP